MEKLLGEEVPLWKEGASLSPDWVRLLPEPETALYAQPWLAHAQLQRHLEVKLAGVRTQPECHQ